MSNIDKAAQVIYDEVNQTWERGEILTTAGEAERLANALADAGLLATGLAQEVLRMREELIDWANDEARAHNALVRRAQEAGGAGIITTHKTIYNRILEILGDHDE